MTNNPISTPLTRLEDWLALLEQRHPTEIELGLERIAAVARRAGIGKPAPQVITVAGTNGKGSCVATLAALLRHAGVRVGVYTSPHLVHYNERIALPEGNADDATICASFARIEQARDEISLTYFEFGTLAAFDLMARANCEVAILEVGLGGRLDAVNLIDADVAVITAIDLDHQDWLGDSRDRIGVEKAGIARPGQPVLVADPAPPAAMLAQLQAVGAQPLLLGHDFGVLGDGDVLQPADRLLPVPHQLTVRLRTAEGGVDEPRVFQAWPELPLPSVLCALQAAWLIDRSGAVARAVQQHLPPVRLSGRWEKRLWRGREVWLDVAHNAAAARLLAERVRLARQEAPTVRFHGVCGIMADKDAAAILAPMAAVLTSLELTDLPDMARAARATDLAPMAALENLNPGCSPGPEEALQAAVARAQPQDRILVFGSFFVVGPLLQLLDRDAGREAV